MEFAKKNVSPVQLSEPDSDLKRTIGLDVEKQANTFDSKQLTELINIKLTALGQPIYGDIEDFPNLAMTRSFIQTYRERSRALEGHLCPADKRVQDFLNNYLQDIGEEIPSLIPDTLALDRHGLGRALSLPPNNDYFESDIISSYRLKQGVLHNPKSDRRTTKGVFHVTEGGLPIPDDKKAVPKVTFARMLKAALNPPQSLLTLPFTSAQEEKAHCWVSLLLRPVVCPEVAGFCEEKRMEVRFFAPGNLVSNLDFVESIFGNAGDPYLADNDAGLDVEHWSGHTGCVILAPHLINLTKKELGLPHISEATERQKRDGMCWEKEDEKYNDGSAFKLTLRDKKGVIVTIIADNYFGYCKKEVKTQISYAANLYGLAEEEHAGGALAFPAYDLGEDFYLSNYLPEVSHTFADTIANYGDLMDLQPEGYGIDKRWRNIIYVPEDVRITLHDQKVSWKGNDGETVTIKLQPDQTYVLPSGYKVEMVKPGEGRRWRLVGIRAEGTLCHKPCTVSGGGKSEISKPIADAIIHGPNFVADIKRDFDQVEEILNHEYGSRFRDESKNRPNGRPLLSSERSLGSVIKLLTVSPEFTDEHNNWIRTIPPHVKELVLLIKRFYKEDWGANWRERFTVDIMNGHPGNELKYRNRRILSSYLRVGYEADGSWRTFSLRKDFNPAYKIQEEDDITAAVVVPSNRIAGLNADQSAVHPSVKFVKNCEFRLFQRPDDAIVRGYDKQTEFDLSQDNIFVSNYEPLTQKDAVEMVEDSIRFDQFTKPMRKMITSYVKNPDKYPEYFMTSAQPRIVDGKPSKNPRYLQTRPDLLDPRARYLADVSTRFYRRIRLGEPVPFPVNAVVPGRRNNPPEPGVRPLAVYNPIHYMELPELFMEYIASMTGKSPSTTGAGSEGALTKGPFNAILPIHDLNSALISHMVTRYHGFVTAAGYVGPKYRVDHDVSLLIPEVWSRLFIKERDPQYLIKEGYLEKCEDFEHEGQKVLASRLGYRITGRFVRHFFGRIFGNPDVVFTEEMLKPELQDMDIFVDGMLNITATHERVAQHYFNDGSIDYACPPLKALLHIMAYGEYEGKGLADPEIRKLFDSETIFEQDWYLERLEAHQKVKIALLKKQIANIEGFISKSSHNDITGRLDLQTRLQNLRDELQETSSPKFIETLKGTIGGEPGLVEI